MAKRYGKMMQLWPGGESVEVFEDGGKIKSVRVRNSKRWSKPTAAMIRKIEIEQRAERYVEHELQGLDNQLVEDMMKHADELPRDIGSEWSIDNVSNIYPDASEWDEAECKEWLDDHGYDYEADDDEDVLRDAVRDNAEAAEIYQWFRVSNWLAEQLNSIGECVLDNAYGQWWGRGCCGQSVIMDGTMQKIAAKFQ